jgi:hypothetical protein
MIDAHRHDGVGSEQLHALASALDRVAPPADLRHRVIKAAAARRMPPRRGWMVPVLAFAAGVLATWWLVPRSTTATPEPVTAVAIPIAEPATVVAPSVAAECARPLDAEPVAIAAPCRFEIAELGVVVDVWDAARMSRRGRTLVLDHGAVTFDVAPVGEQPPIEVDVGAGSVRVIGTRFEIQSSGARGHLDLIHGRVQFHGRDGVVHEVEAGTRFSWARDEASHAAPAEPAPATAPRRAPAGKSTAVESPTVESPAVDDLQALLDQVARRRLAADYREAEALLRGALARIGNEGTAEVLSFELGTVLELGAPARACEHWRAHARRFVGGTSMRRTSTHLARLECDSD